MTNHFSVFSIKIQPTYQTHAAQRQTASPAKVDDKAQANVHFTILLFTWGNECHEFFVCYTAEHGRNKRIWNSSMYKVSLEASQMCNALW